MTEQEVDLVLGSARQFVSENHLHLSHDFNYSDLHGRFPRIIEFESAADLDLDNQEKLVAFILFPTLQDNDRFGIWSLLSLRRILLEAKNETPDFGSALIQPFKASVEEMYERLKPTLTEFQIAFFETKLKSLADRI